MKKKEVRSSDSMVDLFAPPPWARGCHKDAHPFFLLWHPLSDVWCLPTNRHRLPTNRHRLPTNRHRLPTYTLTAIGCPPTAVSYTATPCGCLGTAIGCPSAAPVTHQRHRLHTNCHGLPTNRHRLPTNRHRLPIGRHCRAYTTLRVFFSITAPLAYGPCATKEGEGKEGLAKFTPCRPSHFQKAYLKHHPERNNSFGGGRLVDRQGYRVLVEPRGLPQ